MDFKEYQEESKKTSRCPKDLPNYSYLSMGLAGEAGEIINQIKKIHRDDNGEVRPERVEAIKKELGDILWYVTNLATVLDLNMDDVAKSNLEKLFSRLERGTLVGDGDNR